MSAAKNVGCWYFQISSSWNSNSDLVLYSHKILHSVSVTTAVVSLCMVRGPVVLQTSITLLWTMYELAKQPGLQEELRTEIAAARKSSHGDVVQMLKMIPLVKGAVKETLRYEKA